MSTEDRVRAATRARAGLVRQVRPLELPDELPARGRRARRARRARDARHWLNWGAPLAAAALVTALALALVLLRQAPPLPSHPVAPTSAPAIPASVPRYYAVLTSHGVRVADVRTGFTLAAISEAGAQEFTGVTAAADDRTFVANRYDNLLAETTWYLVRITPGAASSSLVKQLPIKPLPAKVNGLALSPDGRELAVMVDGASGLQLSTYSVSSGALLGNWHTSTVHWMLRAGGANAYGLSWLADGRHIAFRFDSYAKNSLSHLVTVRTLSLAAAGHDLLANSRLDLQVPLSVTQPAVMEPCPSSVATPDGRSVVCGTGVPAGQSQTSCKDIPPSFVSYSTATGARLRVLYQDSRRCPGMVAVPLWANSSGSQVIGLFSGAVTDFKEGAPVVGLIAAGHFTPFPGLDDPALLGDLGAIAF